MVTDPVWVVVAGLAFAVVLSGCGPVRWPSIPGRGWVPDEPTFAGKPLPSHRVRLGRDGLPVDTVIGERRTFRIRPGDTLLDVARYYDVGHDEILYANPGVDPWVPGVGTTVTVPGEWVLPCCTYEGIVINIPEMRLFFYRREGGALLVDTFPVGLGRTDRRTPRGKATVITRTVNPRWNIPEPIRQEHVRERGDARTSIAGGDPDNPLGKYRLGLSLRPYSIHGTNVPWGTGSTVSHGCARLYPEDIERLFPLVPVGTAVELTYQPVKVGGRGGRVFVQVLADVYGLAKPRSEYEAALARLRDRGLEQRADRALVKASVQAGRGLPVRVSN